MTITLENIFNTKYTDTESDQHKLTTALININTDAAETLVLTYLELDINAGMKDTVTTNNKLNTWIELCKRMINPLSSCDFEKREDYDKLFVAPFCCNINDHALRSYGINIYENDNRIMTIMFRDTTQSNNSAALYVPDKEQDAIIYGKWSADVKPAVKIINGTGLNLISQRKRSAKQQKHSADNSILSTYYRGNTITITDLVEYINKIKASYDVSNIK